MADGDDPQVITLRRSTVVRAGIAALVLVALGGGIAIGLLAASSPTVKVQAASDHKHRNVATTTTAAPTTTTAVPPTTTSAPPVVTTTTNPERLILSPADSPPVSNECSEPISQSADGNPYPSTCPSGGVNIPAWRYVSISYSNILGLGANSTESQVLQTMCNSSPPYGEVEVAAQLAATYYGWPFASDPAFTGFDPANCPG
jgi:hypothetical protein